MKDELTKKLRSKLDEVNEILNEVTKSGLQYEFECSLPNRSQKVEGLTVRIFEIKEY